MAHLAWCYKTEDGMCYWTESYTLSVTEFANKVSQIIGKNISPGDTTTINKKSHLDLIKRRASTSSIYIS